MENEIWKIIPGTDEQYAVSNFVRVKSLYRPKSNRYNTGRVYRDRILTPSINKIGYNVINIKNIPRLVHRLYAQAFLENPLCKKVINHKNGIRHDNSPDNIEWATQSENVLHAFNVLGWKGSAFGKKGKDNPGSKMLIAIDPNGEETVFYSRKEFIRHYKIGSRAALQLIRKQKEHHKGIRIKAA